MRANQPFGHSTIAIGSDKAVGLVPNSTTQAAVAVTIQAEEAATIGVPLPLPVPGQIESSDEKAEESTTIYVTPDQANAMRLYITGAKNSSQSYDATFHNCANFSEEVLRAGGVHAPADITPGGLVNDLSQ